MLQLYLGGILAVLVLTCHRFLQARLNSRKVLKIREIYVYPIKSLRGAKVSSALATKHGFEYDRQFMLLQVTPDGYKNMSVCRYPEMTQFLTSIDLEKNLIGITFRAFGSEKDAKWLKIPMLPNTEKLEPFDVNMHGSPTKAFKMQAEYSSWFSDCFGYQVELVYLGEYRRDVLFQDLTAQKGSSWLKRIVSGSPTDGHRITFADCAPYLIVSKTSLQDVSSRLPAGEEMDITKFRPNIVIEGADKAWEEDYWGKIRIGNVEIAMKHNCVRCKSINVDYETGKPGLGESGEVLKKLQKDRRIDTGAKWSPVFGRYSYWNSRDKEQTINVGDEVVISGINKKRTVWSWPDLS